MSTKTGWWATLCMAAMWTAAQSLAAGEPRRVVEQPELKQALEDAPVLQTESLGEPARGVNVWERRMEPNHGGQSWDVLQVYFNKSGG